MKARIHIVVLAMLMVPAITMAVTLLDEGFEGSFPPTGWTILNLGDQTAGETWMQSSAHHHSGSHGAFSQDGEAGYAMEEWLITPAIAVPLNNYIELTFWHKFEWASFGDGPEYVLVSTTTPTADAFTDTILIVPQEGEPINWTEVLLNDLPDYGGETIYIGFVHTSANGYADAWVLDDMLLESHESQAADVGMVSIEVPEEHHLIGTEIFPSGTIRNYGATDVTVDFDISCEIVDELSITVYSSTIIHTGTFAVGATAPATFTAPWAPAETGDYVVTIFTALAGDGDVSNDTLSSETQVVEHQGTGGPDAFGYRWIDSEEVGGPVFDWIEIAETGTSAVMYGVPTFHGDDNFSEPIDFGFDFPFYGIDRTYFHVDINGEFLLAENTWYEEYHPVYPMWKTDGNMFNYMYPIPGYSGMPALVAAYWDDLYADEGVGDVYFQRFGEAPDRYCVVEWHNLRFCYGTVQDTTLCFEVIFHENGDMIFQYQNTAIGQTGSVCPHDNGRSATVGIQNDTADIGLCYLREIVEGGEYVGVEPWGNLLQDELAIRFYMGEDDLPPAFVYEEIGNTFDATPACSLTISDMSGVLSDSIYYNTGGGWAAVGHSHFEEPNIYYYELPVIPISTTIYYYFVATDNSTAQNRGTLPENAPSEYYSFKILPTDGIDVLLAYPGSQDYQNLEFPKYTTALDAENVVYDVYNWKEYEQYSFPGSYKAIFTYANSAGSGAEHDTLSIALMNFMDLGTNENPKNVFMASDDFGFFQHGHGNEKPMVKFLTAYMRVGYRPEGSYPGGTDGLAGPDVWEYENGSVIGVAGSPIGEAGVELPVYADTPDVLYSQDCPSWYAGEVSNPGISSQASFLFEDGPFDGDAYAKGFECAIWLNNLIYKSFYTSFDISQFTNDADINMIISDAVAWFGISTLAAPSNVDISVAGGDVTITWDAVTGATSYEVYSSDTPYEGFLLDASGEFHGTSWTSTIAGERKYYYVKAVQGVMLSPPSDTVSFMTFQIDDGES